MPALMTRLISSGFSWIFFTPATKPVSGKMRMSSARARILNPFFFASVSKGGASTAASTKPWEPNKAALDCAKGNELDILVGLKTEVLDYNPRAKDRQTAERRNSHRLAFKLLNRFDLGSRHQRKNRSWHEASYHLDWQTCHRASESHAGAVIQISAAQRCGARSAGNSDYLGVNSLFFKETLFVRQWHGHKLAAQVCDTDSNLICRLD